MEVQHGAYWGGANGGYRSDESSLIAAAASELSAPLVLLRQLSLALAADDISATERQRLTEQVTLVSERALRMTRSLMVNPDNQSLIELEPVNAMTLCQEVVHELTPLFTAHGKSIALRPRMKTPLLIADRSLLRHVLVGLGDNALHFSEDARPVELTISAPGDTVRVGIRDYGPAVPTDIWQRLEGHIAKRSTVALPRRPQASGIGLMAARKLAEAMGGYVGVTRHRDGATFYVALRMSGQMNLL